MPLFRRNKPDISALVAEEVKNALAGTPMAGANATPISPPPVFTSDAVHIAGTIPMSRPAEAFQAIMGPAVPLVPQPLDPVDPDTGRPLPRRYQYQVATNLVLTNTEAPWTVLRSLTEQCDIIHRAIEIAVSNIVKQGWSFAPSPECIAEIMEDQGVGHAKAAKIAREKYGPQISSLTEFWENPYPQAYRGWSEWITEALWQHFPFDGIPVYPRVNLRGDVIGFEIIDAPTIKILLDDRGNIPLPPAPAYQQLLWGFPRGEFQAAPETDGDVPYNLYSGAGRQNQFVKDQLAYFVKNRRTWTPYGYSAVEQAIPMATLYLERQNWMRQEYQSGAMAHGYFETDNLEMTPAQITEWNRVIGDWFAGQTSRRQGMYALPGGFKPVFAPSLEDLYKPDLDERIIKQIAALFGIEPTSLGIVPRSGLGGKTQGGEESDAAEIRGQRPTEMFVVEMINSLCRRFLNSDKNVTFVLDDNQTGADEMTKAKAYQIALTSAQMTINEVRGEQNLPLLDMPEADEPFILTSQGAQFLTGALAQDATGETVGQESAPQAPQDGEASPQNRQAQASGGSQTNEAALERKKFARFREARIEKGVWRDFEFTAIDEDEAKSLNAEGRKAVGLVSGDTPKASRRIEDLPGHHDREKVIAYYAPKIRKALTHVEGVDQAIRQAMSHSKAADPLDKATANGAVHQHVRIDGDRLLKAVRDLYADAGMAGTKQVMQSLGTAAIGAGPPGIVSGIDWSTWKPGAPEAAQKVAGKGLKALLDRANIVIDGINQTTLNRIGNALADGLSAGSTYQEISSVIDGIINDPSRADTIAITETQRAYNAAALDSMEAAGVETFDILAYDGACEECEEAEGENPHELSDDMPPLHVNCRCGVAISQSEIDRLTGDQEQE